MNNIKIAFILLLMSAVSVYAANKTWDGGGADDRWLTAANWDANTLPASGDLVYLSEPNGLILIEAGDNVKCTKILGPSRSACTTTFTITDGNLTNPSYWKVATASGGTGIVNIQGDANVITRDLLLGANGGTAVVNMTGGVLNITGATSTVGLIMPYDESSSGTINISAGVLTTGSLNMASASEYSPALIDIGTNATVRILGDVRSDVQTHISNGYIKANGGSAQVVIRYNGTYTILQSSFNPAVPVATNPSPASGAADVSTVGTVLSWQAGSGITKHNVYFGADESSLSLVSNEQTATTYNPGNLGYDTVCFWRVDEVQGSDVITGMVWNFYTRENIAIECFENYADTNALKTVWKDGSSDSSSGSSITLASNYNEGAYSCQFNYDNTGTVGGKYYSEIEAVPVISDFLVNDAKALDVWYNGIGGNSSQPMYIALSDGTNTATVTKSGTSQTSSAWVVWRIALSEFTAANSSLNLHNITKIYIGIGSKIATSSGGQGTVYIDCVNLWPARCLTKYSSDLNGDCRVDLEDLVVMAIQWLLDGSNEKVMDTSDPGFSQTGFTMVDDAQSWNGNPVAVSSGSGSSSSKARYVPNIEGQYDVYMYWRDYDDKDTITYWSVKHTGGTTTLSPTQLHTPGWNLHGTYELDASSYIELEGSNKQDAEIVADAVKFVPTTARVVDRVAKDTITPIELNIGDTLNFELHNGQIRHIKLISTEAHKVQYPIYSFSAVFDIDGVQYTITRSVPTQESFYEPTVVNGMRIWLDAVTDMFQDDGGWMINKDRYLPCRPKRKARLVVNDVSDRICPDTIVWWYPETDERIDVNECYDGNDTWIGPYGNYKAHGGLDIAMANGTSLYAPISFDDQYYFDSLAAGDDNNRWRGIRNWSNGSIWWLQSHHLNQLLITEHQPLAQGVEYAYTAGVKVGGIPHTHFAFRIFEEGEDYLIDPWIFFWQTFKDN